MPYIFDNPNPKNTYARDCSVRAISRVLNKDWEEVYVGVCCEGLSKCDMPNAVWEEYAKGYGFKEGAVKCKCPNCVSVSNFAKKHTKGKYLLVCQNNVVALVNGDYFDIRDSGDDVVLYYYHKGERNVHT